MEDVAYSKMASMAKGAAALAAEPYAVARCKDMALDVALPLGPGYFFVCSSICSRTVVFYVILLVLNGIYHYWKHVPSFQGS